MPTLLCIVLVYFVLLVWESFVLGYVLLGYVQLSEGRLVFKTGTERMLGAFMELLYQFRRSREGKDELKWKGKGACFRSYLSAPLFVGWEAIH